jgi:spore coat protein U-like protein
LSSRNNQKKVREEKIMKLGFKLSILLIAMSFACAGFAQTTSGNMTVTANIGTSCTIGSPTLDFGTYLPATTNASSPLDAQTTLTWTCTSTTPGTITLGQGAHVAAGSTDSIPLRQVNSGSNNLGYFLYQDAGRSTVWGNTESTGVAVIGTGVAQNTTVYGRIPGGQNVPAGSYADSVVITLSY